MSNFICETLTNPAIFWSALEALATVLALGFIYFEVRRLRRESIAYKVEGFRYAMEIVGSAEFQKLIDEFNYIMDASDMGDWPLKLPGIVRGILRNLEIIASLINSGYMDENLFLRVQGLHLGELGERIRILEEGKDTPHFDYERQIYPNGRALLRKAEEWRNETRSI